MIEVKVGSKIVQFGHTAVNLDMHMFIGGRGFMSHEPKLCPECIQPGSLGKASKNEDVDKIVEAFKQANNVPSVRPTDRTSARVLAKAYGADNIIQIIQVMAAHKGEQYVPSINHIKDIETKWVMIERWFKKNQPRKAEDYGF